jgi:hypothetical protein
MGVTRENFKHYKTLKDKGVVKFTDKLKIMELGSQTVHFQDAGFFREYLTYLDLDPTLADNFPFDVSNRIVHETFGHTYDCIDLDPLDPKAYFWDLNTMECPEEHKGVYDIVTNHGTTEHLIGQATSFKMMHDLTKKGGAMISVLPFIDINHGLFSYNPIFFESLAKYNDYEIVGLYVMESRPGAPLEECNKLPYIPLRPSYVHCILKKQNDNEFVFPSQIHHYGVK